MYKSTIEISVKINHWKIGNITIIRTDVIVENKMKFKILKKIMDFLLRKYKVENE